MNKAILMGRLTRDPELRTTSNNIAVCTFTLAVDRRFKNQQGERETDFIPIVVWRQTAEFVNRYFRKGSKMVLVGSIQVRSWEDNDGNRRWTTEVVADEVYFAESKAAADTRRRQEARQDQGGSSGYDDRRSDGGYNRRNETSNSRKESDYDEQDESFFESPDDDIGLPFDL